MSGLSDKQKYRKYKKLAIQLNNKYQKHKQENLQLKNQLYAIQNGGAQNEQIGGGQTNYASPSIQVSSQAQHATSHHADSELSDIDTAAFGDMRNSE
jgi:hypothetical protein